MNYTLITCVVLYLLGTLALGVWAGSRIKNTSDFAVAGRSLPLIMVITTTFATWFGAETVMGVPAKFVQGGLNAIIEDPFGAGTCLILVGLFFATKLYKLNLLTIGDYYRQRFGRVVEVLCSLIIIVSYLGWVGAQITALGLVFNLLSQGAISLAWGMTIGTLVVLVYTLYGGMWSVAMTDFVQMIVITLGLLAIAWFAAGMAGGADKVIDYAAREGKFRFWPTGGAKEWLFFIGAAITMMFGSIPQQDVFQRVMSAKNAPTARTGAVIGGDGFGFAVEGGAYIKIPQTGRVVIGDDVDIGANTCIDRGALADTVIEDGVKLDNLIQIGHNCHIGQHTAMAGCVGVAGSARIGAYCTVGGAGMILGHLTIADHVHISSASIVTRSIHKPGHYTGFFPIAENGEWEKNAATLKQIYRLRDRVKHLEEFLPEQDQE